MSCSVLLEQLYDQFCTTSSLAFLMLSFVQLNTDWNKYDDRLMKAAERGDVEKVSSILAKKGVSPTKLDVEGRSA